MAQSHPQRRSLTYEQDACLWIVFQGLQYLNPAEKKRLAEVTGLETKQVGVWFQRRNTYYKKNNFFFLGTVCGPSNSEPRPQFWSSLAYARKVLKEKSLANNPDHTTQTKQQDPSSIKTQQVQQSLLLQGLISTDTTRMVSDICSSNQQSQLRATKQCREYTENHQLSMKETLKVVPQLVRFLDMNSTAELRLEAAWAIKNITSVIGNNNDPTRSPEQIFSVVSALGVSRLVALLNPCTDVTEHALSALGNIAADCLDFRDHEISCGVVPPLHTLIRALITSGKTPVDDILRKATWLLSILCYVPLSCVTASQIFNLQPVLTPLLCHVDPQIASDACWALSYLTDGATAVKQTINLTALPRLVLQVVAFSEGVNNIPEQNVQLLIPLLHTIANIIDDVGNSEKLDAVHAAIDLGRDFDRIKDIHGVTAHGHLCFLTAKILKSYGLE